MCNILVNAQKCNYAEQLFLRGLFLKVPNGQASNIRLSQLLCPLTRGVRSREVRTKEF